MHGGLRVTARQAARRARSGLPLEHERERKAPGATLRQVSCEPNLRLSTRLEKSVVHPIPFHYVVSPVCVAAAEINDRGGISLPDTKNSRISSKCSGDRFVQWKIPVPLEEDAVLVADRSFVESDVDIVDVRLEYRVVENALHDRPAHPAVIPGRNWAVDRASGGGGINARAKSHDLDLVERLSTSGGNFGSLDALSVKGNTACAMAW